MISLAQGLRRSLALVVLCVALTAGAARAESPEQFVQSLGDRATEILKTKTQTTFAEREQTFRTLLLESFDIPTIARFVLGRHARTLSEAEYRDYEKLFIDFIVRIYALRFDAYSGETFRVDRILDQTDDDVVVRALIERPGGQPPVRTDWRIRTGPAGPKVIDVYVEGISMLNTQRQEFAAVIDQRGVEGLMDEMRARLVQIAGAAEAQTAAQ